MAAFARLVFAESAFDAVRLLREIQGWLDFGDEDESRLYQYYRDWFYDVSPGFRPSGWNPERERKAEELMAEQSLLERNTERWLQRHRQELLAEGRREAIAEGRREALVRLAARHFGADTGRRLEARFECRGGSRPPRPRGRPDPGQRDWRAVARRPRPRRPELGLTPRPPAHGAVNEQFAGHMH